VVGIGCHSLYAIKKDFLRRLHFGIFAEKTDCLSTPLSFNPDRLVSARIDCNTLDIHK